MKRMLIAVLVAATAVCGLSADFYVDHLLGHDAYAGTAAKPKKTLQAAINAAAAGDVIHVAPGTYAPFSMDRKLTIIGTEGPHRTFIDGSGKYRCAKFADVEGFELRGFTLQNGYAGKDHGGGAYLGLLRNCIVKNCRVFEGSLDFGGGGVYKSHLYDTIVEGCRAGFGGAMHEGKAFRCTFRNNYAKDRGGALWCVIAHQSLVHGNVCDAFGGQPGGGGAHGSWLYNCTVTRNTARRLPGAGGLHECYSYNTICHGNRNPNFPAYCEYRDPQARFNDHFDADPRFVRPDHPTHPDFHLRPDSPARRVGDPKYWEGADDERWDRDRNPRFHDDGAKIDAGCYEEDESLNSVTDNGDGTYVIKYNPNGEECVTVAQNGVTVLSSSEAGTFLWQPQTLGAITNVFTYGITALTNVVRVTAIPFATQQEPEAPMALDNGVVITPLTRNVKQTGAGHSVTTAGSTSDWTAATSADWIRLTATSGEAGLPVAYTVSLNTNAEKRVGYVYVSGHVHTITQAGVGSTLATDNAQFESAGGTGSVALTIDNRFVWKARSNVDWISVTPTNGMSNGTVTYTVAPLRDVTTRSGTLTIGGNTFTVFQYGRRMGLSTTSETCDYDTHVIPITVNALAITEWTVTPNNSWISVVDAGKGKGSDLVTIAVGKNPSFQERTGTVTIGTETFRVTQTGTTEVSFAASPAETTGSANGANGRIAITATSDLPWSAVSSNNWLTIYSPYASGAGNGNVVYTVSPNTTVSDRTGVIVVTPDPTSGLAPFVHTVRQPAPTVALSSTGCTFAAAGESQEVTVTVSKNVQWQVAGVEDVSWLSINGGATSYLGTQTITLAAASNETIYERTGTITIAGKTFTVTQKGRGVEIESESVVFDTEGGMESFSVHPDGEVSWTAVVSDPTWITIYAGGSGTGDGEVMYIVSDYTGDGGTRTGTITVGNQVLQITQTAYQVTVSPNGATVSGNSGAGEFAVSADIGAVWNAIATAPWITIVSGYDATSQSGKVMFTYTENTTGKTRTGKITINGTEYTLTQQARTMVAVSGEVSGHGGSVANAGSYDLGASAQLEAVADAGYAFAYWTLPDGTTSMVNPLSVKADVAKTYVATFEPLTPDLLSCVSGTDGVTLTWTNLAWAVKYNVYRGSSDVPAEAVLIDTLENDGTTTYLDATGDVGQSYFYWIEAEGLEDKEMSAEALAGTREKLVVVSKIEYTNLKGLSHANPATYQEGETTLAFTNPSGTADGYTFAGWTPSAITTETTGDLTVRATWKANSYTVVYDPNGGSGTIANAAATYDEYLTLASQGFAYADHIFKGWATEPDGPVVYQPGATDLFNLTGEQNGVVTLYAVWEVDPESLVVAEPVVTPADGSTFKTETCTVTITCATTDAAIYYTTNGRTPAADERYRYTGPFAISNTTTVVAFAYVNDERKSDYVEATLTYVEPTPLTWKGVLDEDKLGAVTTGGDAEWQMEEPDAAQATVTPKVGDSFAVSGAITEGDNTERTSWLKVTVNGKGTLSFWWKVDCEPDPRGKFTYDHGQVETNGTVIVQKDGTTDWMQQTVTFDTDGEHEVTWTYVADGYTTASGSYAGRMWLDGLSWSGEGASDIPVVPSVSGDTGATVTGDATSGWTITPSEGVSSVEVTIPDGVDAAKVTVEVGADVAAVKPHGAKVKVVRGGHDITDYLDVPSADAAGSIDLTKATVKEAIQKETLDPEKGAKIELGDPSAPSLTTPATRPGLRYTLREGTTLGGMSDGATKLGDGSPWTPEVKVKGGASGFYSIKVTK